jgi:hypothetical protein
MADIVITAANFIPSANASLIQGTAGATIVRGNCLYLDSVSGTYKVLVLTSTTTDGFAGFACEDAALNQPVIVCTKDPVLALGGTLVSGDQVWASNTGVTKTQADLVTTWRIWALGVALSATTMNFLPCKGGVK